MLIAMTKSVLEVIALVFQGIKRFIFDAPACSTTLHEPVYRALVDPQVSHPTEVLDFALERFPAPRKLPRTLALDSLSGMALAKRKR